MAEVISKPCCSVDDCNRKVLCKEMCVNHYARYNRNGDLRRRISPKGSSLEDRLHFKGWQVSPAGCWEIHGAKDRNGYGMVSWNRRNLRAHRTSYEVWVGPIPEGHVVRHKCDNPPCINPEHLETGTPADNNRDTVSRGRSRYLSGESHGMARLTNDEVREIRTEYLYGVMTQKMLGEVYGVLHGVISGVVNHKTYSND